MRRQREIQTDNKSDIQITDRLADRHKQRQRHGDSQINRRTTERRIKGPMNYG